MAGFGYKYLAFLVVFHVLMFQAQSQGFIDQQTPQNQHKKFVEDFSDNELTKKATISENSGIIQETFSSLLAISDLINAVIGIVSSPYSSIQATGLPPTLKMLVQAIVGLSETYVAYLFVQGNA